MKGMRLNVMIPTRDRTILTQKSIESVLKTSKLFSEINISIFDNLTNPTPDRIAVFSKLLSEGKIQYYSYNTTSSICNCFAKAYLFQQWIREMKVTHELRKIIDKENSLEDFYLLLDSDIILGPKWDKYFITACKSLRNIEKDIHFLVKFIGGVPNAARKHQETRVHTLKCSDGEEFKVMCSIWGGGSAFWFNDFNELCKMEMPLDLILKTYGKYKGHDTGMWNFICNKFKMVPVRYVGAVIPPDPENPLVLHIGESLGCSICNILTREGPVAYNREKHNFAIKELELKDMTAKEIYDKYKMLDSATIW